MPDLIKKTSTPLEKGATVDRVYGEPIRAGDRLIVPVARVAHAYWGAAGTRGPAEQNDSPNEGNVKEIGEAAAEGPTRSEKSGQMSGNVRAEAMAAAPAGVLEITEDETRFVPFFDYRPLLAAGLVGLAIGLLIASVGGSSSED